MTTGDGVRDRPPGGLDGVWEAERYEKDTESGSPTNERKGSEDTVGVAGTPFPTLSSLFPFFYFVTPRFRLRKDTGRTLKVRLRDLAHLSRGSQGPGETE